jgi:nitroreductase
LLGRDCKPDLVPVETVDAIVAAAQRTSSSSNLQTYGVVAVTESELRACLAELCGNQQHVAPAPFFLAWCADFSRLDRIRQIRGYTLSAADVEAFLVATIDAAKTMQTAAQAAESLGLGMCHTGGIRNQPQAVIELLGLPALASPISGTMVDYLDGELFIRTRLTLRAAVHWERYGVTEEAAPLAEYDREMIETGIYRGRQVPVPGFPD